MKVIKILFLFVLIGLMSCGGDDAPNDADLGYNQTMVNYMADQGWEGQPTIDGMYYVIIEPGGAEKPTVNDIVSMNYKGYYVDGEEFDSGEIVSRLDNLIQGWKIGVPKFGVGGSGHLLIPPNLAYGEFPNNGIRNRSVLIFDIELLGF